MSRKEYRVTVYDADGKAIARVRYNNNLDYWNGRDWTCGALGRHKGLTRLKDGRYVLIHGTDWMGERDWAEVITPKEALYQVLKSGNTYLLDMKKFKDLKALYDEDLIREYEEEAP